MKVSVGFLALLRNTHDDLETNTTSGCNEIIWSEMIQTILIFEIFEEL